MRRWVVVLVALLAAAGLASCAVHRSFEALDLIRDVAAVEGPSALKRNTAEPVRQTITYTVAGRGYSGDIYGPGTGHAKAAAVFVPGVVEAGKDDYRLVAFARSFARMGLLILVPDIPNLRALIVSASDSQAIADAMRHLAERGGLEGEQSIGLFAFSYAAGPALIAALEPDTRDLLRFVYLVGPYYGVEPAVTYFTTGRYRQNPEEPWSVGHPNPYALWVFLNSNAGKIEDPTDRATLSAIARRKLDDADTDVSGLVAMLGPEGRSVYALLTNRDPDRVHSLIAQLPAAIRAEMRALDLVERDLSVIRARLVIMHGRTDPMIPYTESIALARATRGSSDLYLLDNLSHVELRLSGLSDIYRLWRAAYVILKMRDTMPAPRYGAIPSSKLAGHGLADKHGELPQILRHIVTQDVNRTVDRSDLEIAMIGRKPPIHDLGHVNGAFADAQPPGSLLASVFGITLYFNSH